MSSCSSSLHNPSQSDKSKSLFVCVGTTEFDELIECVDSYEFHTLAVSLGCDRMTIQIGNGKYIPRRGKLIVNRDVTCAPHNDDDDNVAVFSCSSSSSSSSASSSSSSSSASSSSGSSSSSSSSSPLSALSSALSVINYFRFSPCLHSHLMAHTHIVSHCGAGCILDSLRAHKRLLVVVNTNLMDNHQLQLAQALSNKHFLLMAVSARYLFLNCKWRLMMMKKNKKMSNKPQHNNNNASRTLSHYTDSTQTLHKTQIQSLANSNNNSCLDAYHGGGSVDDGGGSVDDGGGSVDDGGGSVDDVNVGMFDTCLLEALCCDTYELLEYPQIDKTNFYSMIDALVHNI
eukprot:GHVQ01009505.1.p1 GENE.GHVQ01009505.1~~GHVQ01009505.1.p1  ORF type:complete len:344 (+),score=104.50 GHVQ01009505.1:92-1123(+)